MGVDHVQMRAREKADSMTLSVKPIDPVSRPFFGGVASGIDLTKPISDAEVAAIDRAMDEFGVLVFHDQPFTDEQQLAFGRRFGVLEQASGDIQQGTQRRVSMELNDISNLDEKGKVLDAADRRWQFSVGTRIWHSDSSFKEIPAKYSMLSARVVPPDGPNTEFADMRAGYDAVDEATKALIEPLVCEHSQLFSRGMLGFTDFTPEEVRKMAPVQQPLVRRHPTTGRKSLFLSSHAGTIVGWLTPEARQLLQELTEIATQRQFVYAHAWKQYDLVIWDNRVTMHRVRRYMGSQVRDMRRITIEGARLALKHAS
jgi:alpha-ketoglutarate-dependent 2,4-dichlorophenoxyacetate dioxygenase